MPLRVIIFLALYMGIAEYTCAQKNEIDSLESLVKSVPADTNKVWLLNTLVSSLREKDNIKALAYATEAKDLAELLRYNKGLAHSLENLGWILYRKGDYTKSFDLSSQALKINEQLADRAGMARCLINLAAIHYEQKQYPNAINHFKEAYRVSEGAGDKKTMARSLNNIAYSFLQMNRVDSTYNYAKLALAISQQVGDKYMVAFAMRTIGDVYMEKKDISAALENYLLCLKISVEEGNTFLKVSTLHRVGKVYKELREYDKAINYFRQNLEVAEKYGYKEELERTYKLLADTYSSKKDITNAYLYQTKYIAIHDSLYEQRQSEKITLMQAQFNDEIKQAQIELLTKEAQLNEEEINSQKIWLYFSIGCVSLLLILAFVLLYANRYNSLAKRELQEKNKAINSQAQQLKNLNATKDKLFSIISHDLRSPLASLQAVMELVGTPGLNQEEFINITRVLKRNLDSVHEDLDNLLMWAQTQLKGFQAVPEPLQLRELAEEKINLFKEVASAKQISITNNIQPETVVLADRNHISLALRNLLANAIKFNQPGGNILMNSREVGEMHEVSVTDSGVGISIEDQHKLFNAETHFTKPGTNKEKGVGIGLLITKEFIERNNGSIWVTSELGKGTTFTFTLKANRLGVLV
jgi:two-component system, sensor histidine kinase and response regulator